MAQLADTAIRRLAPPAAKPMDIHWDDEIKGFGVRVTKAGSKAFLLDYRTAGGIARRMTIGSFPDWSCKAAREEAKRLKRLIDQGEDPMADRRAIRQAPTMTDLWDAYERDHLPSKAASSQRDDKAAWAHYLKSALGKKQVTEVHRKDIDAIRRGIAITHPPTANRTLALLSNMFTFAIGLEWRTDNPVHGVKREPMEKRERYLSAEEIQRLMAALDEHPRQSSANAVRLLLLTGARRGEVLSAAWSEFDLDAGIWTKPSSHTKQKKLHRVPLNAGALVVLADMRDHEEKAMEAARKAGRILPKPTLLFPATRGNADAQASLKNFWSRITKDAGIEGVRIHDLRHSYASVLVSSGLSLPIIGQLLGHTQAPTTHRYAHLMDAPLREATERAGAFIKAAGEAPPKVVPITKKP